MIMIKINGCGQSLYHYHLIPEILGSVELINNVVPVFFVVTGSYYV